jgi:hypothetical protein
MEPETPLSFSQAGHYFPQSATAPQWVMASPLSRLHDHTQTHHTRQDSDRPDLITHNTHKRQTSIPLAGFEPSIPASERPQNNALVHAATGTCSQSLSSAELVQSAHSYSFSVVTVVISFSYVYLDRRKDKINPNGRYNWTPHDVRTLNARLQVPVSLRH